MARIDRFEDFEVWQNARVFCKEIFGLAQSGTFSKDYALRDQINKSSGSIMDNIAEGFERGGNREFLQFLSIAKASSGEVRSQLYRAFDRNHLTPEKFEALKDHVDKISRQLSNLIKHIRQSEMKGPKYAKEPLVDYNVER